MLSLASPGEAEQKPTYKDADYVVTHPMDDDSLPIKQSVYDEWQDSEMKREFKGVVQDHHAKFNVSGQSWKPKRQVEDSRESPESRAVVLKTAQKSGQGARKRSFQIQAVPRQRLFSQPAHPPEVGHPRTTLIKTRSKKDTY